MYRRNLKREKRKIEQKQRNRMKGGRLKASRKMVIYSARNFQKTIYEQLIFLHDSFFSSRSFFFTSHNYSLKMEKGALLFNRFAIYFSCYLMCRIAHKNFLFVCFSVFFVLSSGFCVCYFILKQMFIMSDNELIKT